MSSMTSTKSLLSASTVPAERAVRANLAPCLPDVRPLPTAIEASRSLRDGGKRYATLVPYIQRPWLLPVRSTSLQVRPAVPGDLQALAAMHSRCSARSLLDRYRAGGRGASVAALQRQLRRPLAFVAVTPRGAVVAFGIAAIDSNHSRDSAEIGLLVEDGWQGVGIGRELLAHLAGAAAVCGYRELIAYTATSVVPMQHLLVEVGHCRVVGDVTHSHLHTSLPESAALGLGSVRDRMAS
jgi:GNAT superfamily N-acetyltransferase